MFVISVARKPLKAATVAANVLADQTGGININATRVGVGALKQATAGRRTLQWQVGEKDPTSTYVKGTGAIFSTEGRFPANLILQHHPECKFLGTQRVWANQSSSPGSGLGHDGTTGKGIYHGVGGMVKSSTADADGMEEIESWQCQDSCPVSALNAQSGIKARYFKQVGKHE